jgi:hypothetical protein
VAVLLYKDYFKEVKPLAGETTYLKSFICQVVSLGQTPSSMPGRFRQKAKVAESQFAKANRSDRRFLA